MKILYLDCTSGISGDMTLAALLDLGLDKDYFLSELAKLHLDGYELIIQKKARHSIQMMDVDVILKEAEHDHSHDGYPHHHADGIHTDNHQVHHHSHERNLSAINHMIDESGIEELAKQVSKAIFLEIAMAEAKVHGKDLSDVHFHEVGAVDSIVDIVGVSICIAALKPDVIYASELHDGSGFIQCRHGLLPVPVPAVMAMLEGSRIPLVQDDVGTELITPTGMGIIKCLATKYTAMPLMTIEKTGYGLGKRETGKFGAVRAFLGTIHQMEN